MGQPAESRSIVAHLLNVSYPYSYSTPKFALICQGVEELTENFEADSDDVQYICETTKTTNVKGYTVGFDLSLAYIKNSAVQKWANRIIRKPPTGSNTSCDYIRFNKDELMYGTTNQFIGVRRNATVQASSIGGSSTDSMSSEVHISGTSDPEVGYVTVDNSDQNNVVYSWTPATTDAPVITSPVENETVTNSVVTISGTGIVGASVVVAYGINKYLEPVTVDITGSWSAQIEASEIGTNAVIAAIQTTNGMSSISSDTISFTVVETVSAPIIVVPANGATNVSLTPTISGTGTTGATVTVTTNSETILEAVVSSSGVWTGIVETSLEAETEYTITARQTLGTITSSESESVTFTTTSE